MELFETNTDQFDEDRDYLSELVGEGKKFKEYRDLAKGKAMSDFHITQLERENAEMREELSKRRTIEQVADQLMQRSKTFDESTTMNNDGNQSNPNSGDFTENDDDDFDSKVEKAIESRLRKEREKENLATVKSQLEKTFGKNYGDELARITEELGETQENMLRMAQTNPRAFFRLTGIDAAPVAPRPNPNPLFSPPQSSVSTVNRKVTGDKTWAYYQKMRRESPEKYYSIENTREIHETAKRYASRGEDFYSTK